MAQQMATGTSMSTKVEAEHRLTVISLHGYRDVPMPYGHGSLNPTHAKLRYVRYGPDRPCSASAQILGQWKTSDGRQTDELEEIDFPQQARFVPDWVRQLLEAHCPIGWAMPSKAGPTTR